MPARFPPAPTRQAGAARRARGHRVPPAAALLLLVLLAPSAPPSWGAPKKPAQPTGAAEAMPQDPRERARWLQVQNAALKARVELAKTDAFYLLLDPVSNRLKLMLKGATLQSYPIEAMRVGGPRVAYKNVATETAWVGRTWSKGVLAPERERERIEIIAPPPTTEAEAAADSAAAPAIPIPPTPEEAFEVPAVFWIRYADGLALEILAAEPKPGEKPEPRQERPSRLSVWWRNAVSALRAARRDPVRLQLTLSSTDAASLYRCLPPDSHLLVLPPP